MSKKECCGKLKEKCRRSKNILRAMTIFLMVALILTNGYWLLTGPKPTTQNINFAYQVGFHYGANIIMDELNLIEENSGGIMKGSFFKISGGSAINEAILAGSIDFGQMSGAAGIKGIDKGLGTKILASMGAKEHELWTWREDIQTVADLEGTVVSVVKINSVEQVGLIKAFVELGKTKEDVDAISVFFSHSDSYVMMEEGTIDAHFAGAPYNTLYAENPRYHKIASDTSIWGLPLAGGVILGRTSFDAGVIEVVLESFIEAVEWIAENPREASKIIGATYEYDEDKAWDLWQKSKIGWGATMGLDTLEAQAFVMYNLGLISEPLSAEDILFAQTLELMG